MSRDRNVFTLPYNKPLFKIFQLIFRIKEFNLRNHLRIVESHWKLVPYYVLSFGLSVIVRVHCTFAQVTKYIFLSHSITGVTLIVLVTMLAFGIINISTNIFAILSRSRIANDLNALVDFQENFQPTFDLFGRLSHQQK